MTDLIVKLLLWFSAVGCGLIAGIYFAFSTFIMPALGRIEPLHAVSAMNSINSTILRSLFMPLFFGTTLTSAALAVIALLHRSAPGATAMFAGGLIYVAGMFLCTIAFNVPLNNRLAAVESAALVWTGYLKEWTMWNHVRTITSTAACILYTWTIVTV
jgi:uncharacterized membrane protein